MAFQQSPGVNFSEIDLTTVVPGVGSTVGGFAGNFNWGPVDTLLQIDSEISLVETFGKPDTNTFVSFFTAANFLAYGNDLRVVRAANNNTVNATANGNGVLIKNEDKYLENYANGASTWGTWAAKYPGDKGNSLKVSTFDSTNTTAFNQWAWSSYFDGLPGTSAYAGGVGGANDEIHIVVVDEDGRFTGTANTLLEKFAYVSKAYDATNDDGSSNYYKQVVNDRSKYVWWMSHPAGSNWNGNAAINFSFTQNANAVSDVSLSGGLTTPVTDANLITAYDAFKNEEIVDVSLIMMGDASTTVSTYVISNIAEVRRDCVVYLSPKRTDVVDQAGQEANNIVTTRNSLPSSSYAFMDANWKYQFDKYNNVYRYLPYNGDVAGLTVRTDNERDPWYSPAGFNRGNIKNVVRSAWNPSKSFRDTLYKKGVNSIVSFPGEGTILYGDKTLLSKPSAFDRINVRRLFIVIEKAIVKASKYSLFEFNDDFTRAQFINLVEPYLRDVKGRRGIFDFRVVCDETNNTPEVIDRNEFIGDIYIKPARSINFIQLNFIAVRTGVAFEEIVGRF